MTPLGLGLYERAKIKRMTKKSFSRLWKQIQGFSKYGFCLGHALAFADHAQGTAYLLRHHPAEFLAAVLSVEPCGFWPVATVVAEAQRRGVKVLPPCVNWSASRAWMLEECGEAIRCSLIYVRNLGALAAAVEEERRVRDSFTSLADFCRRCHFLSREQMEWLTLSGGLVSFSPNRRQTLWSLPALHHADQNARQGKGKEEATGQESFGLEVPPLLPQGLMDFTFREAFLKQWGATGFSSEGHPMQFHRQELDAQEIISCDGLQQVKPGEQVRVAGLVIRPHRPPSAGGTVFFTLEDETGLAHVTVTRQVYDQNGAGIYGCASLVVCGRAEQRGYGTLLLAEAMWAM